MSDNKIHILSGLKPKEPEYTALPPKLFRITYREPDGSIGNYTGRGVMKMNGPLMVFTPEDRPDTTLQDAIFFIMFEHFCYATQIEDDQVSE